MTGPAYQQFSTVIPFILILFLGYLCGKSKMIEHSSVKAFGHAAVNYLTPFMVLDLLQKQGAHRNSSELMWAIVSAMVIFLLFFLIAYIFFLRRKKDTSGVHACSVCSSAVSILAYPLLSNIPGVNAGLYCAMFIIVNQLLFNILSGKLLYSKKNLIKSIITIPFLIEVFGLAMYFMKLGLILPIANTVTYISTIVPILSAFLIGMFFSAFPASGFKLQFDVLLISVFKLLLFPVLTFGICLIAHFSLETTLILVTLAGLPCGIDLPTITSFAQSKNISRASNVTACSFVLSLVTIPLLTYSACHIYTLIF